MQQSTENFYTMDISGMVQSHDSRAASSVALTRTITAPRYGLARYGLAQTLSGTSNHNMVATHHHQLLQHNRFSFGGYSGPNTNMIVPAFANCNFIQQIPLPRFMEVDDDGSRQVFYTQTFQTGFVDEHHSQSRPIKTELMWPAPATNPVYHSTDVKTTPTSTLAQEVNFGTEVDTLMKAIQAKEQTTPPQTTSSVEQIRPVVGAFHFPNLTQATSRIAMYASREDSKVKLTNAAVQPDSSSPKNSKKRYQCTIANCSKSFYQQTHLDIHERAHTGVKPYPCREPGCGRTFSQLGNLKTHERRHTGERPYQCEICGKRFTQRSNVRAHKIVHDQVKPYLCRLDDCGKQFTQLGNLKSHQNIFHIETIRRLTAKFTSIKDGDIVHAGDKELWEYFANLYKNSNKGIKGRGKGRKVGSASKMSLSSGMRSLGVNGRGFNMAGSGRGNMISGMGEKGSHVGGQDDGGQFDMLDRDDGSQNGHSHSNSRGASSVGTCHEEDALSDVYDDHGGGSNELAFADRIY